MSVRQGQSRDKSCHNGGAAARKGNNVLEFPWPLNNAAVRVAGWQSLGFLIPSESPFQVSMCVCFSLRPSELLAPHALEY